MKHLFLLICTLTLLSGTAFSQPCNEPPAAIDCESAPLICDLDVLNGYCTSLENVQTANGPIPICANGVPDNPLWVAFYAGCTALHFTITPSNCTGNGSGGSGSIGIQAAIYGYHNPNGCTDSNATPDEMIACSFICPMEFPILLTANNLQVGRIYYLFLDGCAGSYCDISISIAESCDPPHIEEWALEPLEGPMESCTGSTSTYSIEAPSGAIRFHWYLDGQELDNEETNALDMLWSTAGTFELCVDASNHCVPVTEDPKPRCITVTITDLPAIDPDTVWICENDTYAYDGKKYAPGTHEVHLPSSSQCDSIVNLVVNGSPVVTTDLGDFVMCKEDTVFLENTYFTCNFSGTNEVVYQQAAFPFCDSVITFDLLCLYANAGIVQPPILGKGTDTVKLDGTPSVYDPLLQPIQYSWFKVDSTVWQFWSDSVVTTTSELGTYCLVLSVYTVDSLTYCSDTACVVVDSIMSAIHPVASIGQWQISPVPARDLLTIQCQGTECPREGILECWDILGRKINEMRVEDAINQWSFSITSWPTGPYLITWKGHGRQRILIGKAMVHR
ncbi:MAG: hypothetical protein K9I85_15140 [Saprospiraceae bacterium]|nr:hypothetical protein [Saprospiraceae bacterium]